MDTRPTDLPPLRALLVFNPISGAPGDSPTQLLTILQEMQAWNMLPEVHLLQPGEDLVAPVKDALRRGIRMVVVSGGDGTIDTVAGALAGSRATLGVIPTGTRNNVALSLGIPGDIPGAVALLRNGRCLNIDVGLAICGNKRRYFLEACAMGLISALFPAADDIQHGNLARIGDFLSTLVSFPIASMRFTLDNRSSLEAQAHIALIGNMPYIGPNYQITSSLQSHTDGLLELLVFSNLSKLDLIGNVVSLAGPGPSLDDPRIQRYLIRRVTIHSDPPMPVIADGFPMGEGPLQISVHPRSLRVMASHLAEPQPESP